MRASRVRLLKNNALSRRSAGLSTRTRMRGAVRTAACRLSGSLHRRTFYAAIRAEHAAVAGQRLQQAVTRRALVEPNARIGGHHFRARVAAFRTGEDRDELDIARYRSVGVRTVLHGATPFCLACRFRGSSVKLRLTSRLQQPPAAPTPHQSSSTIPPDARHPRSRSRRACRFRACRDRRGRARARH
jgi:hypothetical protein